MIYFSSRKLWYLAVQQTGFALLPSCSALSSYLSNTEDFWSKYLFIIIYLAL